MIVPQSMTQAGATQPGPGAGGAYPSASGETRPGAQLDRNNILFWYNTCRPYAWIFWSAVTLAYILMIKNYIVLVVAVAITLLIRIYGMQIDGVLRPIWPLRNLIPLQARKLLGWVVPVAISFYFITQPALWSKLGWLPFVGPTASMTILMSLIGAFTAYILVREPAHLGPR